MTIPTPISSRRARAVTRFLAAARALVEASPEAPPLAALQAELIALAQQAELFPLDHFPVTDAEPSRVYRLAEDLDGRHALYASAGRPGKTQPPHDHTTWAVIAGVSGNERNVLYRREPGDRLVRERSVDVQRGTAVGLTATDVHTIELVGDAPGLHLHFYGLALDRLHGRVVFEGTQGGNPRHFAPPKLIRHPLIAPAALQAALADGHELALLDVREAGAFAREHLLFAVPAPAWRLEGLIHRLVPRVDTRIVLTDLDESLSHAAAARLVRLGYRDVSVLAGGTRGWAAQGHQVYSGTNVPSKAFGERVEQQLGTPHIEADDLAQRLERGDPLVIVDSRTPEEFQRFALPGAHHLPGGELAYRIGSLAPDPRTLVVVNCAGRTRSILGAQTLINAGIPNPVAALKDGTMAWLLSGRTLVQGRDAQVPEPAVEHLPGVHAHAAAAGVQTLDSAGLAHFEADASRTLVRLDVRTREEFEAGHLPGWQWAPGGQLIQATDQYLGTRGARVVLADWDGVRAPGTAAWLAQLGGYEVFVHAPPAGAVLESGPAPQRQQRSGTAQAAWITPKELARWLAEGRALLFDVDHSLAFAAGHIDGARFATAERLHEFTGALAPSQALVITSADGVLARQVASQWLDQRERNPQAPRHEVRALLGGTRAWLAAGLPTRVGSDAVLTGDDDAPWSPYHAASPAERDAGFRAYLAWEVGLLAQLAREGEVGMRLVQPGLAVRRRAAVQHTLGAIRRRLGPAAPDRAALAAVARLLEALARQDELFPRQEFPPPASRSGVGASTRYRLNPHDGDDGIALYLNAINPGKTSIPHNHDTWAVIVAIEGEELNRLYRRIDDGRDPAVARLVLDREVTVRPGQAIQFLPQDIHSIHVTGEQPTLHFHLYGRPLETLSGRVGFDLATGAVLNYNATQLQPSQAAA